ncbi:MAG: hypothetical protein MI921_01630 [Cytophagales bacterium]|nr:hypothetical protein [Cytophagales bacterium]
MKISQKLLSIFSFTVGIYLASSQFMEEKQAWGDFIQGCSLAHLNEINCGTIFTAFGQCTVTNQFETVPAYQESDKYGRCISPLYRQIPQ